MPPHPSKPSKESGVPYASDLPENPPFSWITSMAQAMVETKSWDGWKKEDVDSWNHYATRAYRDLRNKITKETK